MRSKCTCILFDPILFYLIGLKLWALQSRTLVCWGKRWKDEKKSLWNGRHFGMVFSDNISQVLRFAEVEWLGLAGIWNHWRGIKLGKREIKEKERNLCCHFHTEIEILDLFFWRKLCLWPKGKGGKVNIVHSINHFGQKNLDLQKKAKNLTYLPTPPLNHLFLRHADWELELPKAKKYK